MNTGWLGYDIVRVRTLGRRVITAADELAATVIDEPAAADAVASASRIAERLLRWLPVLERVGSDLTLTGWDSGPAIADAASARDQTNRRQLDADLATLSLIESADALTDDQSAVLANARSVAAALADADGFVDPRTGRPVTVQLYVYEPGAHAGDGRAAIALGDVDTAAHVAVMVPGMGTEASRFGTSAQQAVFTSASAYTSEEVAVMTWVGYDAPSIAVHDGGDDDPIDDALDWIAEASDLAAVLDLDAATVGAAILAADTAAIRSARSQDVHMTVIGNSYGSTTVAIAADEFGLAADDLVLTGSPGAGRADHAGDLTTGHRHTWVGSASDDPVTYLGRTGGVELHDVVELPVDAAGTDIDLGLGNDPAEDDFGARRFQAEWPGRNDDPPWSWSGHGHYFDPCAESLGSVGAVVAGRYAEVQLAAHRHKDESWDLWDPLGDLFPDDPEADQPVNELASLQPDCNHLGRR